MKCEHCGCDLQPGENGWQCVNGVLCQLCWESDCAAEWWKAQQPLSDS